MKDLIMFEKNVIRRTWHNDEWCFSIVDVIEVLTENKRPRKYWSDLKKKIEKEGFIQLSEIIGQLKMLASDGKMRTTDVANTKGIFRIIQSITSPKAEPFKQWLAKVGYERIQEIENPELIIERIRESYKLKGYTDEWITIRLQSIGIRKKLTDEWKKRKVKEGREYAILTAEMSHALWGLKPSEHKKLKGLQKQSLRDHMTEKELIFTMLGEVSTRDEAEEKNAIGFIENKEAAKEGGKAAKDALKAYEKSIGKKVLSKKNFLKQIADKIKGK